MSTITEQIFELFNPFNNANEASIEVPADARELADSRSSLLPIAVSHVTSIVPEKPKINASMINSVSKMDMVAAQAGRVLHANEAAPEAGLDFDLPSYPAVPVPAAQTAVTEAAQVPPSQEVMEHEARMAALASAQTTADGVARFADLTNS